MLGVRRFQKHQIDVWQGNPRDFHVDFLIEAPKLSQSELIARLSSISGRHCAIVYHDQLLDPTSIFAAIKAHLGQRQSGERCRITVIANHADAYDYLQEALFNTFEDL
jgi:hypothetical protein